MLISWIQFNFPKFLAKFTSPLARRFGPVAGNDHPGEGWYSYYIGALLCLNRIRKGRIASYFHAPPQDSLVFTQLNHTESEQKKKTARYKHNKIYFAVDPFFDGDCLEKGAPGTDATWLGLFLSSWKSPILRTSKERKDWNLLHTISRKSWL